MVEREKAATKRARLLAARGHDMYANAYKQKVCRRCSLGPGKADYNRWLARAICGGARTAVPCGHQPGVLRLQTGEALQLGTQTVHESHNVFT